MTDDRIESIEERLATCEMWINVLSSRINTVMDSITGRLQEKYSRSPHKEDLEEFRRLQADK